MARRRTTAWRSVIRSAKPRSSTQRADDGFRAPVPYTPPVPPVPGVWIPTAPSPPIGTYVGLMRPFSMDSADQFRPGGPPDLGSTRWARDYNEVKAIGSSTSTTRTAEQTAGGAVLGRAARATGAPVRSASSCSNSELDIVDAASVHGHDLGRLRGLVHRALRRQVPLRVLAADHGHPRRRDRRQRADHRGPGMDAAASRDPNHPEYPSAHSCITPAGGGSSPGSCTPSTSTSPSRACPDSATATTRRSAPSRTRSATHASGVASTTAPQSTTGSPSGDASPTTCLPTTSTEHADHSGSRVQRGEASGGAPPPAWTGGQIAPVVYSSAISSGVKPAAARTSTVSAPSSGAGPPTCAGVSERRIGVPTVRPSVDLGEVAVLPHLRVVGDLGVVAHRRVALAGGAQDVAPLGGRAGRRRPRRARRTARPSAASRAAASRSADRS